MPIETNRSTEIARLTAARDEALRRYAEHTFATQLKTSKWSALAVRRGPSAVKTKVKSHAN